MRVHFLESFYFYNKHEIESQKNDIQSIYPVSCYLGRFWQPLKDKETLNKKILPLLYVLGMMTFAISISFRIVRVMGRFFLLLLTFFNVICGRKSASQDLLKEKFQLFNTSVLKLLAAPLGIICPPFGYYLENQINNSIMPTYEKILYYVRFTYEF